MRKLPPLNVVRAFEAAARHVSFTRAASELSVTHGAVSKQVAMLEGWLSMQLLEQASPTALRINAPPIFTMRWLIPRISAFQRKRPDVEVRFTTSIAPVNFQERGYDIAIRGADQPLSGKRIDQRKTAAQRCQGREQVPARPGAHCKQGSR